jgi:hypothetical protein
MKSRTWHKIYCKQGGRRYPVPTYLAPMSFHPRGTRNLLHGFHAASDWSLEDGEIAHMT